MSVCAALFFLLLQLPGTGTDTPADTTPGLEDEKPVVEETILVTATRSERSVSSLPMSATVIDEEDITSAPARSVDDLLRDVPGVHLSLVSSSGSTPNNQRASMHGLGGMRVLILVDGIPLHDPYSGIAQWQMVPLGSLRQIEVVRGGNASLFGNFALGGTINLITRPIEQSEVIADASYGSGATARAAVSLDHVFTPALSMRLSHNQSDSGGFMRVPNPGPIDVEAWTDTRSTALRSEYRASERAHGHLNASMSEFDVSQGTPATFTRRDVFAVSGGAHHGVGASGLLSARLFHQRQSERLVNSSIIGNRVSESLSQDATIPSSASGGSLELSLQRAGAIRFVSMGVDLQQITADEDRMAFNRSGAVTQTVAVGGRQRFGGLFAQASWHPSDRLEILTSARLDIYRNENGYEHVVGGTATDYPDSSSTQLDPRVSVRYAMSPRSAVRGSVYRAFNAPTLRDLYRTNQSGNSTILGNPFLEPETLVGGEIGWEWAGSASNIEVNVYRSTIEGLNSRVGVPGQPPTVYRNENLGTSVSQGVEIAAGLRLSRRWSFTTGYTFADSTITEDPAGDLVGNLLPEVSRHVGSLAVKFTGDHGTRFDARGRVLSRSYGEPANLALSPAHRVVDLSISHPVRAWADAYALLENALDEKYYLALAPTSFRSGLPRTFTAGLRLRMQPRSGR